MFGKHYESAEATVLSAEVCNHSSAARRTFEFVLEVRPPTRQAFRTTIKEDFVEGGRPRVGDVVNVKYNSKNLQVKFDLKGNALHHSSARQSEAQTQQATFPLASGTPPSQPSGQEFMQALLQAAAAQGTVVEVNQQPPQVISGTQISGTQLASLLQAALAQGATMEIGQDNQGQGPTQGSFDALWRMAEAHGTVLQGSQEAQLAVTRYMLLAKELASRGESGTATILHLDPANLSAPPLVAYSATIYVMPSFGAAFETTFTAWINTNRHNLYDGETVQVKYDPNDHTKIVFVFP